MSKIHFMSVLSPFMERYLDRAHAIGCKAEDIKYSLIVIDRYLYENNHTNLHIDKVTYEGWLSSTSDMKGSTRYQRASVFRRLLLYMSELGVECYIPRLPSKYQRETVPYIFTRREIFSLFSACDELRAKERHPESIVIIVPALMRTLYSTGIRISEALNIKNGDVDFNNHVITLNTTKNGNQRLAPINESLESVLRQYIEYRNRLPYPDINNPTRPFFVASNGKRCSRSTIGHYFRRILQQAGIPYRGNGHGPRLHDLRHTACIHALKQLTDKGYDAYCCLPYLSTFMGHRKVLDTEYYLRLTKEMYPDITAEVSATTSCILSIAQQALNEAENGKV